MAEWLSGVADWMLGWRLIVGAFLVGGVLFASLYRLVRVVAKRRPQILFLDGSLLRHSESGMRRAIWRLPSSSPLPGWRSA